MSLLTKASLAAPLPAAEQACSKRSKRRRSSSLITAAGVKRAGGAGGSDEVPGRGDEAASLARRDVILRSVQWAVLGEFIQTDATTVVNSILGAYGLPQLKAAPGFRYYDDLDEYVFEYPKAWVGRRNRQRPGVYFSDFNTADKAVVEAFQLPEGVDPAAGSEASVAGIAQAAVATLVNPGGTKDPEQGGDSRLELPSASQIKTANEVIDGTRYIYLAFPSSTTTRSGYDVKRKNFAVAAVGRGGTCYVLGASARRDQFNPEKEELLKHVVQSFRLR